MTRLAALFLALLLGGCAGSGPEADRTLLSAEIDWAVVLDAGTDLLPEATPAGVAWVSAPTASFVRTDRKARSRTEVTRDGVIAARRLALRADVAPGEWRVRFWVGGIIEGAEDNAFTYRVDGEAVDLGWTYTYPQAEPQTPPGIYVRDHASTVTVGADGLTLAWEAPADSVRLLGVSLTPVAAPPPDGPAFLGALRQLDRPATWGESLAPALALADGGLAEHPGDPFLTRWRDRVAALHGAEYDFFVLRGFEANIDSTGLSIIQRNIQSIYELDGLLSDLAPGDPLRDRALWMRARAVWNLETEMAGRGPLAQDSLDFADLAERHDFEVLRMFRGARIEAPDACDGLAEASVAAGAAAWAATQHEALCRIADLTHYWIDERQAANGELGGKLGDDVEILRQWFPLALAGDRKVQDAWRLLSDAVWASPLLVDGYHEAPIDVEHAAEPIADAQPQLVLFPGHAEAGRARIAPSARHMRETWTVPVAPDAEGRARRHFRSSWFGTYAVNEEPPRNRDAVLNARAARAVRFHAWATGDPEARETLHEWARAWRDAALRTDKGKPRGVIPASMRAADLALNGDEPTWYDANMYWRYFDWLVRPGGDIYDAQQFAYELTGDSTLVAPMHATLDLVRQTAQAGEDPAPGSAAWAVPRLIDSGDLWDVVGAWRLGGGDARHDDLLLRYGSPYTRARLTGTTAPLVEVMDDILARLRVNAPLLRDELLYTDRVYISGRGAFGATDLTAMLTGGLSSESPSFAATWVDTPIRVARYVSDATPRRLAVQMHTFGGPAEATVRVWRLEPGAYVLRLAHDGDVTERGVTVRQRGDAFSVELPAGASTLVLTADA
ncbi:MAG: hypothetical protein AAF845_02775 [Bacteroidota bacterium]